MTVTQDERAGLMAQLTAALGLHTEALGKHGEQLQALDKHKRELNQNIFPLVAELVNVGTSATVNFPNILGPRPGWYWDVHTIICQGLTAGSVAGYLNSSAGVQVFNFTTSGQLNWGKFQNFLTAGEFYVYVGSASVPAAGANISLRGVQIAAPYLGDYLL